MGRSLQIVVASSLWLIGGLSVSDGSEPLKMQVSPTVSRAPAVLTVRVTVQASPDDRRLLVTAESSEFYRRSEIPLDGQNTSPLKVFEFRNLPKGVYEVTGVLVGVHGPRATVLKLAQVESGAGYR